MNNVFQSILIKKIEDNNISLFIVDAPTGSGKSYQIAEYIRNNYKNKKIFFLANQHNQILDDDELMRGLNELEMRELSSQTLRLKSIVKDFEEKYDIERLPIDFFEDNKNVCKEIEMILTMLKDKQNDKDIKNNLIKRFYEQERYFRKAVKLYIDKNCSTKNGTKRRKNHVLTQDWICELYPVVYLKDKKVILMTVQKFFRPIDPLYEKVYELANKQFDNAIIFFDEFDASKKVLLDIIIGDNIDNYKVECFRLFRRIYDEVMKWNIPRYLHIKKPKNGYKNEELVDKIQDEINDLQNKFKRVYQNADNILSNTFKTKGMKSSRNFIFNDSDVQTITKNQEVKNLVYYSGNNEDEKTNIITEMNYSKGGKIEKKLADAHRLDYLYNEVNKAITSFINSCSIISENYMNFANANADRNVEQMSFNSACNGIIEVLNLGEENKKFLIHAIVQNLRNKRARRKFLVSNTTTDNIESQLIFKFENDKRRHKYDFYKDGFSYMEIVDSLDEHNLESKVFSYNYNIVPEKLIVNLCVNYKVIGVSATSTIDSVLTNYDLSYFKQILKDRIYFCNDEEHKSLNDEYESFLDNAYDKSSIEVRFDIDKNFRIQNDSSMYLKTTLNEILSSDNLFYLHERLEESEETNKYKDAADLYNVFYKFCNEENMQSFIYFANFSMNTHKILNEACRKTLDEIKMLYDKLEIEYFVLNINEFEEKYKKVVIPTLENGKKVFIITTYQTLGVGVNLKYRITEENQKYYTQFKYIKEKAIMKDFDGIYLSKPTNIFPSFNCENHSYKGFMEVIYALEYLTTVDGISKKDALKYIKTAFKIEYMGESERLIFDHNDVEDIQNGLLRCLIQAVGRICRTKNKGDKIFIWSCYDNAKILWRTQNEQKKLNLNKEFKELSKEACNKFDYSYISFVTDESSANEIERTTNYIINSCIYHKWTDESIKKWKRLREYVLKNPTTDNIDDESMKQFYIEFNEKINEYSYNGYKWKKYGNEMSNYRYSVSEEGARLNRYMQIPGIKNYFEQRNYATSFEKGKFVMSTRLFHSIYKGALGEVAGKYIFDIKGIHLQEIDDLDYFEYFDFCYDDKICFDFKNWSRNFNKDLYKQLDWVRSKAKRSGTVTVFVINILYEGYQRDNIYKENNIKIVTIPWLFKKVSNSKGIFNEKAIALIKEEIYR